MSPNPRPPAACTLTLAELGSWLGAELLGDGAVRITGASGLEHIREGDLVRVEAPRFLEAVLASPAVALLVGPEVDPGGRPALRVADTRAAFARVLALLYPENRPA